MPGKTGGVLVWSEGEEEEDDEEDEVQVRELAWPGSKASWSKDDALAPATSFWC